MRSVELESAGLKGSTAWNCVTLNAQLDMENCSISYIVMAIDAEIGKLISKEFDGKCFAQAATYYNKIVKELQEKYKKV